MAEVFVSYSIRDRKWVEKIKEFLKPLLKERNVSIWSDTDIKPGANWREAIENSINKSQVVVILISQDYLASKLVQNELPPILRRLKTDKFRIFPVIVSPITSSSDLPEPLRSYQMVNSISEPLSVISEDKQAEILSKLARDIRDFLSSNIEIEEEIVDESNASNARFSTALNTAIANSGGFDDINIFFEAEERLAQKYGK